MKFYASERELIEVETSDSSDKETRGNELMLEVRDCLTFLFCKIFAVSHLEDHSFLRESTFSQ